MSTDTVITEIDHRGVARVVLNRPEVHNAFDDLVIGELRSCFESLAQRDDVRVVVLASEGKSFSAGADLGWMKRMASYTREQNLEDARELGAMLEALYRLPQPTIAQVQGAAYGGAVGLAACCDIVVASEKAGFALSEVRIGLVPATISPYVIAAIGERAARRYFVTAERFDAHRAQQLGLVSEVTSAEALAESVNGMVETILANSPQGVSAAGRLISAVAGNPIGAELIEDTCQLIADIRVSAEGQEGLSAFLEKRKPAWQITADA